MGTMRIRVIGSELVFVHHTACRPVVMRSGEIVVIFNLFVALVLLIGPLGGGDVYLMVHL
jgi:hypothetical protein